SMLPNPDEQGHYFQGDIDIDPDEVIHRFKHMGKFRNRFNDFYCKYYCWPGGIVPYYFDPNFASLDESYGGLLGAFGKISSAVIEMGTPYDYSSVMHYSN
ncbi:unnamed protein product, partial [Owenia fusiformis]